MRKPPSTYVSVTRHRHGRPGRRKVYRINTRLLGFVGCTRTCTRAERMVSNGFVRTSSPPEQSGFVLAMPVHRSCILDRYNPLKKKIGNMCIGLVFDGYRNFVITFRHSSCSHNTFTGKSFIYIRVHSCLGSTGKPFGNHSREYV